MDEFESFEVIMRIEYGTAVPDGDTLKACLKATPVQKLVRCKDCKHRKTFDCPMFSCEFNEWECDYVDYDKTDDNGFCYKGERRTE